MPVAKCSVCFCDVSISDAQLSRMYEKKQQVACNRHYSTVKSREYRRRVALARPIKLTKQQRLLVEIHRIEEGMGMSGIELPVLVVKAWEMNKELLGLKYYTDVHPDTNRIIVLILNLMDKGLVKRVGESMYAVTDRGRSLVRTLVPEINR